MGPFGTPWSTLGAWIVVAGSILLALGWALWTGRRNGEDDR